MEQAIKISRILSKMTSQQNDNCYAVFWIQNEVEGIEINKTLYKNLSNAVFLINPTFNWKILKRDTSTSSGYVLLIPKQIYIGINSKLMGQVNICRKALEALKPNGAIILTGGIFAHSPWPETTNIAMVNAALEGFVKALALELTEGRRILVVHPPFVKETAQAMGMDGSNCPPAVEVACAYVQGFEGKETGKAVYLDE